MSAFDDNYFSMMVVAMMPMPVLAMPVLVMFFVNDYDFLSWIRVHRWRETGEDEGQ